MTTSPRQTVIPITELEQSAFCQTDGNLRTKTLEEEFRSGVRWQKVPARYLRLTPAELDLGIAEARKALGDSTVVLGHHYQREDIIKYADFRGDSYKLSKLAAQTRDARFIIFCGVHFMAETADILTGPSQSVILPNLAAGCSMADMARTGDVEECWSDLAQALGGAPGEVIPVTYMNSTAAIKALCGRNGGIVCTSSNAAEVFKWAYGRGKRVLFLPDQHLGRNTGVKFGIGLSEMALWSPFRPTGGLTAQQIRAAKLILWQGHCSVHTRFTVEQIKEAREKHPGVTVVVHPECTLDVVRAADQNGSTEFIVNAVSRAPAGSAWAIGTEINLVSRLAKENPDKTVFCLDPVVCPCATMYRIHPAYLLWVLEGLMAGLIINKVSIPEPTRSEALKSLERMLEVGG